MGREGWPTSLKGELHITIVHFRVKPKVEKLNLLISVNFNNKIFNGISRQSFSSYQCHMLPGPYELSRRRNATQQEQCKYSIVPNVITLYSCVR